MSWPADLAAMFQVSLVGYLAAGAFLPMPYFDLLYQMIALTVLLGAFVDTQVAPDAEGAITKSQSRRAAQRRRQRDEARPPGSGVRDLPYW